MLLKVFKLKKLVETRFGYVAECCEKFLKHWSHIAPAMRAMRATSTTPADVPILTDTMKLQVQELVAVLKPIRVVMGKIAGSKTVSLCSSITEWNAMMRTLQPDATADAELLPCTLHLKDQLLAALTRVRTTNLLSLTPLFP